MVEQRKLLITGITESKWKDKTYYNCMTSSGIAYSTTDSQVKQYQNVEHEFEINSRPDKSGIMRHYINFPRQGGGGFQKSGKSWGGGGQDPEITAKNTIVMQLVELWKTTGLKDAEAGVKFILEHIDSLWNAYNYKTPKTAPQEATAAPTNHSGPTLKAPLVTILKHKTKGWSVAEIVEVFGQLGIEIPHNLEAGEVYFERLNEKQAGDFIKTMEIT